MSDAEIGAEDYDDALRRAMALIRARLHEDREAYHLLRPGPPRALQRLDRLDVFGALSVEQDELADRALVEPLVALVLHVAHQAGVTGDELDAMLARGLSAP